MAPPVIRPAVPADAAAIARVQVDTWQSAYRGIVPDAHLDAMSVMERAERWAGSLREPTHGVFTIVAEAEGELAGFASGGPARTDIPGYDGELWSLYVVPHCQGRGMGRALLQGVAHRLQGQGFRAMLLWALSANPARGFYEAMGGRFLRAQTFIIGGAELEETAYGWPDIAGLTGKK